MASSLVEFSTGRTGSFYFVFTEWHNLLIQKLGFFNNFSEVGSTADITFCHSIFIIELSSLKQDCIR